MNYSNCSINLSDSISGYITANEEDCDNTQYLSVLSQDLTLEEINVTLTNEKNEESNGTELMHSEDNSQPLLFNVDGTNEIYSVQMAQDEDGNIQKYQIQYSENMNGELTPMMETIQFLPLEYEEVISEENCESNDNFVIANEQFISHEADFNTKHSAEQGTVTVDDHAWNVSPINTAAFEIPIKTESENYYDQSSILGAANQESQNLVETCHVNENQKVSDNMSTDDSENQLIPVEHLEIKQCFDDEELYEETIGETDFQHLYLEESFPKTDDSSVDFEDNVTSSNTHYLENNSDQNLNSVLKESIDQPKTNILKKSSQRSLLKDFLGTEQRIVYVQTLPEKENLKVLNIESFTKPSSRSLLKSNQPLQVKQMDSTKGKKPSKSSSIRGNFGTKQTQNNRTKESKQARQFMNFINSTTIPQVPERKERLPRKQQIKPLQHHDEDIIVKEMIVSSKGFVEPVSAEERKHLPVTEYVELLDSGDESFNLSSNQKKRKSDMKEKLIEISDTDDSSYETEPESGNTIGNKHGLKKKRGRPPKTSNNVQDKKNFYPNSPPKISRIDSEVENVTSTLQVIRMENEMGNNDVNVKSNTSPNKSITKDTDEEITAENQKSVKENTISELDTEQNESLKPDVKSKGTLNFKESVWKNGFEYKFECEKCKFKFINKFLLSRHQCIEKIGSNFSCNICKQKFPNSTNLNLHKKSHNKEPPSGQHNIKTTKAKIIPEKNVVPTTFSKPSLLTSKYSSVSRQSMKIPTKQPILPGKATKPTLPIKSSRHCILPVKTKRISVPLISVELSSKNGTSSKKTKIPGNVAKKPMALGDKVGRIEEGTFKPPVVEVTPEKTPNNYTFKCEAQCDKCSKQFENNTLWFEHQVLSHGFKTPDKSIGEKKQKKFVKDKIIHNGIRAAPTVAKSFSMLRNKVQHI